MCTKQTKIFMLATYNSTSETDHLKEIEIFNPIQQDQNILDRDNILGYITHQSSMRKWKIRSEYG